MFKADYHTHTEYSSDSEAKMEDVIVRAIKMGLNEIAITDHIDLDYPHVSYKFWEMFDVDKHKNECLSLKDRYSNDITVVYGVEMGLQPCSKIIIDDFMKDKEFDFVIGSTHCTDRKDLYEGGFYIGKTKEQAYREYFCDVLESVTKYNIYDVYGHLDVICRYGVYEDKTLMYSDYSDIIDEILVNIIKNDKGIEINSSGYRYGFTSPHPQYEFIKRYKELGGVIITVGSDAHTPQYVASYFDEVYKMLDAAGIKAIASFRRRKPNLVGIK